jgi:hypothetical protein
MLMALTYRIVRVADELHYAELQIWIRPGVDPQRTSHEFLSMMRDGQPPEGWKPCQSNPAAGA